ncbi:MAG TPA: hypothetical protein VIL88_16100 [Devosia sp.]|jgi:hypothetical protein|uniref:DUF721 domain-containing protein n=1 Tax=Devosia sp. TaxID=1871048 RepID=UPI002F92B53F
MAKDDLPEPKRRNRAMNIADVLSGALDPVLKKRGFASRDIITHWSVMAPRPYDEVAIPDKLSWPRGERSEEGATLVLRCMPGHALAIAHDAPKIAAAVNRYFGFVLVNTVRLSAEAFNPNSGSKSAGPLAPDPAVSAKVEAQVAAVADDELRDALRKLGHAVTSRSERH